jgi:hypothetical protein
VQRAGAIVSVGNLSDTTSDDEAPQVAVDPAGDAVAVWHQDDHQHNIVSIRAAARSASGGFVSLSEVSPPGQTCEQDDESPPVDPGAPARLRVTATLVDGAAACSMPRSRR